MPTTEAIIDRIIAGVVEGEAEQVRVSVRAALDGDLDPGVILNDGLTAGMTLVGNMLDRGEVFIPDVLWSAEAIQEGLALLLPFLSDEASPRLGTIVIGTVQGDVHDIGKNLVGLMLRGAGFDVVDLGHNVAAETFVDAVTEYGARLLGMSAMLTTTMPVMPRALRLLEARELRPSVRVLVGGAPVTQAYTDKIGADGWAIDATKAVAVAKELA